MKQRQALFLVAVSITIVIIAIGAYAMGGVPNSGEGKLKVVATFYPLAYITQEIGGDRVSVRSLIPYNSEVHSWQPSVADMLAIEEADAVVFNGAGLESWLNNLLGSVNVTGKVLVDTTAGLDLLHIEESEGDDHGHAHEGDLDPHTWVSPYMAERQAERVYLVLVDLDPTNAAYYRQRWESLRDRLSSLDNAYQSGLANKTKPGIIVSHGAFGYLAHRYGFEQYSVIGISADRQPSVQDLTSLVSKMIESNISVLYVDPAYSDAYIVTLRSELERQTGMDVKILKLYLGLGPSDGKDYIGQLESNLESLKDGLVKG
ncbi:MAG: metal ABC transporter substrate-binding protein [Candidatus Verstraetearchaeota archaeon]|nr:metal ABC transporter substrate-binding protein [Candidatus Verstraetearchaeota archaeon]